MLHDQEEEDNLTGQAPNLYGRERKNPFNVPDNFFDELPGMIQNRIVTERKESLTEKILVLFFKPQVAVAVILISVLAIGGVFFLGSQEKEKRITAYGLTHEDLKNVDLIEDFDENMLFDEFASIMDLPENSSAINTEMEDYLIENQADINQIFNEL